MNKNFMSERLTKIAAMVDKAHVLADVGCDHAYVSAYLVENKIVEKAFAMDVAKGPLEKAVTTIKKLGLEDKIETKISNGFEALTPREVDAAVIAGMGGGLTISILTAGDEVVKELEELILEPQSEVYKVLEYLREKNYKIADEDMVFDEGKYYRILKVYPKEKWVDTNPKIKTAVKDRYGYLLLEKRSEVLYKFLRKEEEKFKEILGKLPENNPDRINEVKNELSWIEDALNCFS